LPELLAQKLSHLAPEGEDREFSSPLVIRLRVHLGDLASLSAADQFPEAEAFFDSPLGRQFESVLRDVTGFNTSHGTSDELARSVRTADPAGDALGPFGRPGAEGGALLKLLLSWREEDALERRLLTLPTELLTSWCDHLRRCAELAQESSITPTELFEAEEFVQLRARTNQNQPISSIVVHRIGIAVDALRRFSTLRAVSAVWMALDRLLPVEAAPTASGAPNSSSPLTASTPFQPQPFAGSFPTLASPQPTVARLQREITGAPKLHDWDVRIDSALPFLLLNPLSRLGYLAALDGVLEAAHLGADASCYAAALAYKVLGPPERSWRRSASTVLSAATFVGQEQAIPEASLTDFARRIADQTSPLDIVLTDAILAGHGAGEPVTLHPSGLVIDTQGCFPIAWVPSFTEHREALIELLRGLGNPPVLVMCDAAADHLLLHLDAANIPFLTDAPPTRGETWDRTQFGPAGSTWTNAKRLLPHALLHGALNQMPEAFAEAEQLYSELIARPAAPRAASPQLDRSVSLAASIALGTIAWALWQGRTRTTPQQVLARYADFDARVRFSPAAVRVSLPLGRRYLELNDAGLLAPVRNVPWLLHRSVEFTGG